jgi:4-alpha-glucanotransferase
MLIDIAGEKAGASAPRARQPIASKLPTLNERSSGVLLHPTSLPGAHGSGDLGGEARAFVDFLAGAGQRWWQMLPVGPAGFGESPYAAQSAFAGSPWLVSPDELVRDGLLADAGAPLPGGPIDYDAMASRRSRLLERAFQAWSEGAADRRTYDEFCSENASWLDDFALFRAIKDARGGVQWTHWEAPLKRRDPRALEIARGEHARRIEREKFTQYLFDRQWRALRAYASERGVALIGDVPIFVAHDSADVWQHPELFFLDDDGEPTVVAGCPPDYFSRTGQRWGNPLYRWKRLAKTGYAWWISRLRGVLSRFDALRIDHFIGFQRYWRIPASCPTAVEGKWMKGPSTRFFRTVERALGTLPLIAEDLGAVTPAVFALRDRFQLPGIKILQFAFGDDPSAPSFTPYNFPRRAVVYTGTHDNDTTVGWFRDEGGGHSTRSFAQTQAERDATLRYLGTSGEEIHWDMIRLALASVANVAIAPLQDVLGLGTEARMNRPGTGSGNWAWRFDAGALRDEHRDRLSALARTYGRAS